MQVQARVVARLATRVIDTEECETLLKRALLLGRPKEESAALIREL